MGKEANVRKDRKLTKSGKVVFATAKELKELAKHEMEHK